MGEDVVEPVEALLGTPGVSKGVEVSAITVAGGR